MKYRDIEEIRITDKHGESLVFVLYELLDKESKLRAEAFVETQNEEVNNYMIDNDIRIDVSLDELLAMIDDLGNQIRLIVNK